MPDDIVSNSGQGDSDNGHDQDKGRAFTQDDVNRIVRERLREAETRIAKRYSDYEALKEKAEQYDALQASTTAEIERLKADFTQVTTDKTALETARRDAVLETAFIRTALKAGISADRLELSFKALDRSAIKWNDKGELEGLQESVNSLIKENPFLTGGKAQSFGPTNPAGVGRQTGAPPAWHPLTRGVNKGFGDGGVTPPPTDE